MTPLRTNIVLLAITGCAAMFFALIVIQVNPDVLALIAMAMVCLSALKDIRYFFAGWFLMSPYFSPFGTEGSANIASNLSHNIIVPVIAVLTLGFAFLRGKKLSFSKEDLIWVAFVAYAVLSSFYATKGRYDDVRAIYLIYVIPFLLYLLIKNIQLDAKLFRMLAYVCVFHLVMFSFMCAYEFATGELLYRSALDWADVGTGRRFTGPFGSPIILGVFVPTVFLYVYLAFRFDLLPRFVVWISALLATILVVVTFTRSVWLGAFIAFVYIMYKTGEEAGAKLLRLGLFVASVVMLVGVITFVSPAIQERLAGQENANFRVVMAQASINMIIDKPIVGWGTGMFDDISDRYLFDALGVYIVKDTSHVTLLTILAELGIIGAVAYLLFIVSNLTYKGIRMAELPLDDQLIVAANIGGVITFAINAFLIDMRFYSIAYSWFFVNLGFIHNIYRENLLARGDS